MPEVTIVVYCNNEKCAHYSDDQTCAAIEVFYVDRVCATFRRRPRLENYRQLMQVDSYHRVNGAVKARDGAVLK
jgi:hypothetical protein